MDSTNKQSNSPRKAIKVAISAMALSLIESLTEDLSMQNNDNVRNLSSLTPHTSYLQLIDLNYVKHIG